VRYSLEIRIVIRRLTWLVLFLITPLCSLRAQFTAREYQQRRDALAARLSDGVVLVLGSPEPEADYLSFYQNPSFNYLTGFLEPDAALVMVKRGGQVSSTMFVQPRDPATEVWSGSRLGVEGVRQRTGINARTADQLGPTLDSLAAAGWRSMWLGRCRNEAWSARDTR
jgi:Xaa-Pro aminopeptidase